MIPCAKIFETLITLLFKEFWVSNCKQGLFEGRRSYLKIFGSKHLRDNKVRVPKDHGKSS